MVDGDGYLHLSFDHHGHKLNYCRSIAPDTLVLGDKDDDDSKRRRRCDLS